MRKQFLEDSNLQNLWYGHEKLEQWLDKFLLEI